MYIESHEKLINNIDANQMQTFDNNVIKILRLAESFCLLIEKFEIEKSYFHHKKSMFKAFNHKLILFHHKIKFLNHL